MPTPIQAMRRFKQNPQVLFTELDDGTGVLLHLDSKFYFTLNKTSVFIWKTIGLKKICTEEELVNAVVQSYDIDREQAGRDLANILNEFFADTLLLSE